MAEMLTVVAEELGRVVGMVWSGVGVAVRLNNQVMTTFFKITTRLVQLLLLLTQKAADLLSLLCTDLLLFLSDVGNAVLTAFGASHTALLTICNFVSATFSCLVSAALYSCHLVHSSYSALLSGLLAGFGHLGNVLTVMKHIFILFGSTVIFLIGFIPNVIYLVFTGLIHLCSCAYLKCSHAVNSVWLTLSYIVENGVQSIGNFLCDIPLEAVAGVILGLAVIIGLKYALIYMMDNLILIPDIPLPSLLVMIRRRFIRWYMDIVRRAHERPPLENDTEDEEIDDTSDENGNDNNDNVPDLNLPENQPYVQRFIPNAPPPPPEPLMPTGLARRPLTRQQRVQEQQVSAPPLNEEAGTSFAEIKGPGREFVTHSDGQAYQLYRELEQERENRLCIVCQDQVKCVILLPCRHLCLCDACRSAIITRDNICPVCRRPIMETLRVYV